MDFINHFWIAPIHFQVIQALIHFQYLSFKQHLVTLNYIQGTAYNIFWGTGGGVHGDNQKSNNCEKALCNSAPPPKKRKKKIQPMDFIQGIVNFYVQTMTWRKYVTELWIFMFILNKSSFSVIKCHCMPIFFYFFLNTKI